MKEGLTEGQHTMQAQLHHHHDLKAVIAKNHELIEALNAAFDSSHAKVSVLLNDLVSDVAAMKSSYDALIKDIYAEAANDACAILLRDRTKAKTKIALKKAKAAIQEKEKVNTDLRAEINALKKKVQKYEKQYGYEHRGEPGNESGTVRGLKSVPDQTAKSIATAISRLNYSNVMEKKQK